MQIEVDSDYGAGLEAGVHKLVVRVTIVISDVSLTGK